MPLDWPQLVKAIRAAPSDPLPRQMAIEWLLDRGDPRGEYLAMHQALEGVPPAGTEAKAIWERIGRFSRQRPWEDPVLALGAVAPEWKRGWLEHVALAKESCANLPKVLELEPITSVHLQNPPAELAARLAEVEALTSVRRLMLEVARDQPVAPLLTSPHLRNVEQLSVQPLHAKDAEALVRSPMRPLALQLESTSMPLGPSNVVSNVRELYLLGLHLEEMLGAMADSALGPLRVLQAYGPLGRALERLGDRLDPLESLHLMQATDATIRPLAARRLHALSELVLFQPAFGAELAEQLCPSLQRLERLRFIAPNFGQRTLDVFEAHVSERLQSLAFAQTFQLDLSRMVSSPRLAALKSLTLYDVRFDRLLVQAINALAARGTLRELSIDSHQAELQPELVIPGVKLEVVD